eukprot:scaffold212_cov138-Skeletonema_menzelii.AAC.1
MSADSPRDQVGQLIVDFPTASLQPTATVRFASSPTVIPIRSTLTMIRDKNELWYSKTEEETMRIQRTLDAATLRRTLLEPSAEDLEDGGVHVSQAVGLEKALNPTEARRNRRSVLQHRMVVLRLQAVTNDDEIRRISERLSSWSSERAHTLAKEWITMD